MAREISEKEYCHERLGDGFKEALSDYDTTRRLEVLVDDFLKDKTAGKTALDAGCGLGFFSKRLVDAGAKVTACDLGPNLVKETIKRAGCEGRTADVLDLVNTFGKESFDLLVSSECIEHTPDPKQALRQMCGVLKPGGWMAISTPNLLWYPVVRGATLLKLRPFDGYENFSTWGGIRSVMNECGVSVEREHGLHLFPFQLKMRGLSRWCDRNMQFMRFAMINICVLGRKGTKK